MAWLAIDPLDERVRGHFISNKFYETTRYYSSFFYFSS